MQQQAVLAALSQDFHSELVSRVFSGRSSKLSFTQWFTGMVISTVFRCVLAVNVILNELDVAANVLIQLGCKRAKSKQIRAVFETAHFFTRICVEGALNQSREHFREWIHWFRVEGRLIRVKICRFKNIRVTSSYVQDLFTSSIKRRIRFHVVVVQWTSRKYSKKCDTRTELLFCSQNHFFYVVVVAVAAVVNITSSQKGRVKEFFSLMSLTLDFPTNCEPAGTTGYKYCRS